MNFRTLSLKALFTIALITTAQHANAQENYTIKENNLDRYNLKLDASPFKFVGYFPNMSFGYNLAASYQPVKLLQLDADYYKAYTDAGSTVATVPKDLGTAATFRVGGQINVYSFKRSINNKVILQSFFGANRTDYIYLKIPAEVQWTFAVRGGLQHFSNNGLINPTQDSIMYRDVANNVKPLRDTISFLPIAYKIKSEGFYAGIDFKTIRDVVADIDRYGQRSTKVWSNIYVDVLFSPSVAYSLRTGVQQSAYKNIDINIPENEKIKTGWRIGYQYSRFFQDMGLGVNVKAEIGEQPGMGAETPFFFSLGFGVCYAAKLKIPFLQN